MYPTKVYTLVTIIISQGLLGDHKQWIQQITWMIEKIFQISRDDQQAATIPQLDVHVNDFTLFTVYTSHASW